MEIFGEADRKGGSKTGPITSTYPVWWFKEHIEDLKEDVGKMKRYLAAGMVPEEGLGAHKSELEEKEQRLKDIENSAPEMTPAETDKIARVVKELGDQIRDAMFTRKDMENGLASPHEEARRCSEPIIDAKGHKKLLNQMNINPDKNGRITRNQASKVWKIGRRLLGQTTNIECLRRDISGGANMHMGRTLEQMDRDG